MSIQGINSYSNNYKYPIQKNENVKKNQNTQMIQKAETEQSAVTKQITPEEYLRELQKNNPKLNLVSGNANTSIRSSSSRQYGKTEVRIAPNILAQMASDPEAAKKYGQMLSDIPAAAKWADSMVRAITGSEVKYRQTWIDENGNMGSFCVTGPTEEQEKIYEKQKEEEQESFEKIQEERREKQRELEEWLKGNRDERPIPDANFEELLKFDSKV